MKFIAAASALALLMAQVNAKPAEGCLLNHTITATDSCTSVAAQFQITEADFYTMNPGLHHSATHDCDNLDTGKPFCVCMTSPCPVQESAAPAASGNTTSSAAAGSASGAASAVASSAVSSASAAVSSVASAASSAASSVVPSAASSAASSAAVSPSASASSNAAAKSILGAMTAAFVVAATSALL